MYQFASQPPTGPTAPNMPLLRCPIKGRLQILATAAAPIGTLTHFWHGRTTPCNHDDCEPCRAGMPARWHAYLPGMLADQHKHVIVEYPAAAAESLAQAYLLIGSLRGQIVSATRAAPRANALVQIRITPHPDPTIRIPDPPDILRCLALIWHLPANAFTAATCLDGVNRLRTDPCTIAAVLRDPLASPNGHER